MYPRRDDESDLYGYWVGDGWAIEPRFIYANIFCSGYAAVDLDAGRSGLIGTDGTLHSLEAICGGRKPVTEMFSSFSGFIDLNSQPSRYAAVCTEDRGRRQWGLIDGSLIYRPLPDEVFSTAIGVKPYGEYVVLMRASNHRAEPACGLFNLNEMRLELPVEYSFIYTSRESIWVVSRFVDEHRLGRRFAFYGLDEREVISEWFWGAVPFSCGLGAIREEGGRSYFVDRDLRPAFDAEFDDVRQFSYGFAGVYRRGDAGYIDTSGLLRLLLPYDDLGPFNEFGLAIANRDETEWDIDIIDREGRPRLAGLDTADFWEGNFPHFQVSKHGEDHFFDINLNKIF